MVNEIVVSREQGNLSKLDNIFKPESVIRSSWIGASDYRPDENEWTQNNIKGIFSFLTLRCCNFAPVSRRMTPDKERQPIYHQGTVHNCKTRTDSP